MLLSEYCRTLDSPPVVQVFATDLHDETIQAARSGLYPDTIAADVSDERLRRFFAKEANGYRVRREIREMVMFASHDLLKDSPFSRLDLIACRNLLIYLDRSAQARAFEIFNFSLNTGGLLFLGLSESADEVPYFSALDKKQRIYVHRGTAKRALPMLPGPTSLGSRTARAACPAGAGPAGSVLPGTPGHTVAVRPRYSHDPVLGGSACDARGLAGAAVHARERRARDRARLGEGRPVPAHGRRRTVAQPAAPDSSHAAHRGAGGVVPGSPDGRAGRRQSSFPRYRRRPSDGRYTGDSGARSWRTASCWSRWTPISRRWPSGAKMPGQASRSRQRSISKASWSGCRGSCATRSSSTRPRPRS